MKAIKHYAANTDSSPHKCKQKKESLLAATAAAAAVRHQREQEEANVTVGKFVNAMQIQSRK